MPQQTPKMTVQFKRARKTLAAGFFVVLLALFSLLPLLQKQATAATSDTINFQARLLQSNGSLVPDGYYNVQFKLYGASSGGSALWTETYLDANGVTAGSDNRLRVVNGYLTANLGSQTAFGGSINWDQEHWITMNIGGSTQTATPTWDGEMDPRLKLTAVPYAFSAGQLNKSTGGLTSTLGWANQTAANSILLPDAAGTICLQNNAACGFMTGSAADYIQNGTTPQTADFNITGTGSVLTFNTTDITVAGTIKTGTSGGTVRMNAAGELLNIAGYTQTSGDFNMTGTGSLNTGTGTVNLNGNVQIASGKTLTINGGATRPVLPSEGTIYFDTTTKQLLTYSNGKWQADSRTAAFILAASNSTQAAKDGAQFVADGTDDQVQINDAIAALPAAGGTIYLSEGTYNLTGSVLLNKVNVIISGSGKNTIIKRMYDSATSEGLLQISVSDVKVRDLRIDGNKATYTSTNNRGINISGGSGQGIESTWLLDSAGYNVRSNGYGIAADAYITKNYISGSGQEGISFDAANGARIENNTITSNNNGIRAGNSNSLAIVGNTIRNNTGFGVHGGGQSTVISGNIITGNSSAGIDVANRAVITGNEIISNQAGITVGQGNHNVTVASNNIGYNTTYGVRFDTSGGSSVLITSNNVYENGTSGIWLSNQPNNAIVTNNRVSNNGSTGSSSAIYVGNGPAVTNVRITDNTITDTAGTGYAIDISGPNVTGAYIAGNVYSGTGAATINDAGTGTIFANQINENGVLMNRSSGGFAIQNSSAQNILSADPTTNKVLLGQSSALNGQLSFANSSNTNLVNIVSGTTSTSYTLTLPTALNGADACLKDTTGTGVLGFAACGTAGSYVNLQASTPGTAQTGHFNISGTAIAGSFSGDGSSLTNLNGSNISTGTIANARLAGSGAITITAGTGLSGGGSVALGASTSVNLANTTVTIGSYGSPTQVATFTVDAQGRLTAAGNSTIAIAASQITSGTVASARISGSYTGITGTGTLDAGSITSGFGTINTGDTINGSTINGTAGINTGSGSGVQRIDSSGNLVNIGNITSTGTLTNVATNSSGYKTTSPGNTFVGQYTKLATCTIDAQYEDCRAVVLVVNTNDGYSASDNAIVDFRVKQQAALGSAPIINVEVDNNSSVFDPSKFTSVTVTNTSSFTIVELYGRVDTPYQVWSMSPQINTGTNQMSWHQSQGFNAALPAGTQTNAVYRNAYANNVLVNGSLTVSGQSNLDGNVAIASGKYLTIEGGLTGTRPVAPAEGTIYFDTTTQQLLTYGNGKWQAAPRESTKIVAPSTATQAMKDAADYVADGTADQTEINAALTAAAGGKVYLMPGTFVANATIFVPNNTTLQGAGDGTVIELADLDADENLIENTDTSAGTGVVIRDLKLNGRKDLNTAGTQHGIYMSNMGDGTGGSARKGGTITNVAVTNFRSDGIYLSSSDNNDISDSTSLNNSRYGVFLVASSNNNTTGNNLQGNLGGLALSGSTNNTVSGNNAQGNGSYGFYLIGSSSNNTVSGNTSHGNGYGFRSDSSHNNTYVGNTVQNSILSGFHIISSSNNNVGGNRLIDNGGASNNNAIYVETSDSNTITGNIITDAAATTNYAINIANSTSDTNYLADNTLGGGSINDAGTGTIYANQLDNTGRLLNRSSNGLQIQASTGSNIMTASNSGITIGVDTTISAGKSLTIAGGLTGTRPASPAEGTIYFDTTTKQLLTFANGKWQADRSTATKIVAASNSSQAAKDAADYVTDGTADQTEINAALTAAAGGRVYLLEGLYTISAGILIPDNTTLQGAGQGTEIQMALVEADIYMLTNTNTTIGTGVVVKDLIVNGRKDVNTSTTWSHWGIYFNNVLGEGEITNVSVKGMRGGGILYEASENVYMSNSTVMTSEWEGLRIFGGISNRFSNNTFEQNLEEGVTLLSGSESNIFTDNNITGNTTIGIFLSGSPNNTFSGNRVSSNASTGIYISSSSGTAVLGNVSRNNTSSGIYLVDSSDSTISNNSVHINGTYGIYVGSASHDATIADNTVKDNGSYGIWINDSSKATLSSNKVLANLSNAIVIGGTSAYTNVNANIIEANTSVGIYLATVHKNNLTNNILKDNGGSTTNNAIYMTDSDDNSITGNVIDDNSATTYNYAIYILGVASERNYIADNTLLGGGKIEDQGTDTAYGSQLIDTASQDGDYLKFQTTAGTGYTARFINSSSTYGADGILIQINTANAQRDASNYFIGFADGTGTVAGKIRGGVDAVAYVTTGADYAEYFLADPEDLPQPGEMVTLDESRPNGVKRAVAGDMAAGIISTNPGFVGNGPLCHVDSQEACDAKYDKSNVLVSLVGQVPVKVNDQNGVVRTGDAIGPSDVPGEAMRSLGGSIIGYALTDVNEQGEVQVLIRPGSVGTSVQGGDANFTNLVVQGAIQVNSLSVAGDVQIGGNITIGGHIVSGGEAPTLVNVITSCTQELALSGTDTAGIIRFTAGACATADIRAEFAKAFGKDPVVTVSARTMQSAKPDAAATANTATLSIQLSGLEAGKQYEYAYHVIE